VFVGMLAVVKELREGIIFTEKYVFVLIVGEKRL